MATQISTDVIQEAIQSVSQLESTLAELFKKLESTLRELTGSDFVGDGADGYMEFFTNKCQPALRDNLFEGDESLTGAIKKILENIQKQLIESVDPALGQNNRSI
jgi:predicted ribonuclease toxin of YeeF-YezG toxin-antitoxin module